MQTSNKLSTVSLIAFIVFMLSSFAPAANNPDDIIGTWYCEAMDKSHMLVVKDAGGKYAATVIKSAEPSFVSKKVMKDVVYNAKENKWEGTIIAIKRKKELQATFTLEAPNKLKVVGSILFISKTYYWERK